MNKVIVIGLAACLFCLSQLSAQVKKQGFHIDDERVIFRFNMDLSDKEFDSLMNVNGMPVVSLDSILKINRANAELSGWRVRRIGRNVMELYKPLFELSGDMDKEMLIGYTKKAHPHFDYGKLDVAYGTNEFYDKNIFEGNQNGLTYFLLRGYTNANTVYLSGSFNGWSTRHHPMSLTDSGWVATVKLQPGKYHYKYIVNGHWIHDPDNKLKERNEPGTFNSVYFKYNYTFELNNFQNASMVVVAGSFNDWNERKLKMHRKDGRWHLPLYLREGTHTYKFIVEGNWITDPGNSRKRPDGRGNINSVIAIGDTVLFELNGYSNADNVYLSGDFVGWNPGELSMNRSSSGWRIPYVLAPGNYYYKFIVDGDWMPDPANPHTQGTGDYVNSYLPIEPNHTFRLQGYQHASVVRISGNFNDWDRHGQTLERRGDGWQIKMHLKPGKYIYKFVVDGEYILDPGNPYWEQNEYGTGNSVLWVEP